jgi:hypothetical protein
MRGDAMRGAGALRGAATCGAEMRGAAMRGGGAATCGAEMCGAAIRGGGAAIRGAATCGAAGRAAGAAFPPPGCGGTCAPALIDDPMLSAAASTSIPVFLVMVIPPPVRNTVPSFNWLNGWRFTKPAVTRVDVIEDEHPFISDSGPR